MIPKFNKNGYLNKGIHKATLGEIEKRFGSISSERRERVSGGNTMIKNNRQYANAKKRLNKLLEDLKATRKKYSGDKNKLALLSQGYLEHIEQLKSEIAEYEKMKKNPLPKVLSAKNPNEICRIITRIRIKRKITQSQLAARIGCKQSDISRLERENYRGYSIELLEKIANGLKADIELRFISKSK